MSFRSVLASLLTTSFLSGNATAQTASLHGIDVDSGHDTGWVSNPGAAEAVTAWFVADVPAAPWVRLGFGDMHLDGDPLSGAATRVRITSLLDLAVQELDARTLAQWRNTSAYFNGGAVLVEVVAPPGAGPSRVKLASIHAGIAVAPEATICGTSDYRLPSSDPRAARVVPVGCTVWLIDDCGKCLLTAGHCASAGLQVVQFNVPLSTTTGALQHPPASDQHAIDLVSLQTSGSQGVGNDWAYFGTFANATTGLTPHQAQGQTFALAVPPPFSASDTIRITGYGTDSSPPEWNQVQQTHAGPWMSANGTALNYAADTTGGNSGSPVLHEPTGKAIGIHTHGGCDDTPGTGNEGTSLANPALAAALAAPRGVCVVGLTPVGSAPEALLPGVATTVRVQAGSALVPGSIELRWRANGASPFASIPMLDMGGGLHEAQLPPFACHDAPGYFFAAQSVLCGLVTSPGGAPSATCAPVVGTVTELFADEFQSDLGWTVIASPGLTSGSWERGVPVNGLRGDPPADADGSGACFVTQNVAGDSDVDGGTAFLVSPPMDLAGEARLAYRYWFGSTGSVGIEDGMLVQIATDAAGTNWTTVRAYTQPALVWRADAIEVGVEVPATSTVRLRVAITDSNPGHVVEGGSDAVRATRVDCALAGTVFCSGDGSASACPCANPGAAGRGCAHSANPDGARLTATGVASVSADTLTLAADGMPASTNVLFFQGSAQQAGGAGTAFGDGLRCAGGAVIRLGERAGAQGSAALGSAVQGDPSISAAGLVPPAGGTRAYQAWYRNAATFCTSDTFNTTNGLSIAWGA